MAVIGGTQQAGGKVTPGQPTPQPPGTIVGGRDGLGNPWYIPAPSTTVTPQNAIPPVNQGGPGSQYTVGPNGQTSYSVTPNNNQFEADQAALASKRSQDAASALLNQRAMLNQQSAEAAFARAQQLNAGSPRVSGGSTGDETNSNNAAFGRAKDQAGQVAHAGIAGLQDAMDSRGMTGSSTERAGIGHEIAGAAGSLGELTREQYIQALKRSGALSDRNYQGDITQRGQDMAAQQSLMGLMMQGGAIY